MNKEEHQKFWDELLIQCWRADVSMSRLIGSFLSRAAPQLVDDGYNFDPSEAERFITSLELRRCRDRRGDKLIFCQFYGPVRAFIASRSEPLNNYLWTGRSSVDDIVCAISSFKWTRKGSRAANANRMRSYGKNIKAKSKLAIGERTRTGRSNWNYVK